MNRNGQGGAEGKRNKPQKLLMSPHSDVNIKMAKECTANVRRVVFV